MIIWLLVLACNPVDDLSVEISPEMPTIATVRWSTEDAEPGYVEVEKDGGVWLRTPLSAAATDHEVQLRGLAASTDYSVRVVLPDRNDRRSRRETLTTGALPNSLPTIQVAGNAGRDLFMATPVFPGGGAAVILDGDGNIVWFSEEETDQEFYRVRPSVDGTGVYYSLTDVSDPASLNPDARIVWVSWDGTQREEIAVPGMAHDFVQLPDGTLAALIFEVRADLVGNAILEIGADGTEQVVWSAFDCFDPTEIPEGRHPLTGGWTFANALDYDADADAYTVGLFGFESIARVDRASGRCPWVLGGLGATIETDDPFSRQHQFQVLDDGDVLVFDNAGGSDSRAVEYDLSTDPATAQQIFEVGLFVPVLGDVHRFRDGQTLVTWSFSGQIDLFDQSGDAIFTLNLPLGDVFSYNTVQTSLYVDDPAAE
ncbi:MAG: aryl-sulfate sulfotransferase [Myxococcota bacterium]